MRIGHHTRRAAAGAGVGNTKWDTTFTSDLIYTDGDLKIFRDSSLTRSGRTIIGKSSGKWYWEFPLLELGGAVHMVGVAPASFNNTNSSNFWSSGQGGYGYFGGAGTKFFDGSGTSYGDTFGASDKMATALDMDNGKVWFRKNGVFQNSGDPAAGTGEAFSGLTGTMYAAFGLRDTKVLANFGASAFDYSVPVGFNAGLF
jgi:hypothetical protein